MTVTPKLLNRTQMRLLHRHFWTADPSQDLCFRYQYDHTEPSLKLITSRVGLKEMHV